MRSFVPKGAVADLLLRATVGRVTTPARWMSLSQLAKVFAELSEADGMQKQSSSVSTGTTQKAVTQGVQRAKEKGDSSGSAQAAAEQGQNTRVSKGLKENDDIVTFSTMYRDSLYELSGTQLATRLEGECKGMHHGHMVQCLVEVWRRLREVPPAQCPISNAEAERNTSVNSCGPTPALSKPYFRSDHLLECVFRTLAKANLDSIQHTSAATCLVEGVEGGAWVSELSDLLLQWLAARVACLSPSSSATFLHLIAQQKVLHADAVLQTLRDNIEVYLTGGTKHDATHSVKEGAYSATISAHPCSGNSGETFGINSYAVLLDAIARWQLGFMKLLKKDTMAMGQSGNSCKNPGASDVVFAIESLKHPILSASLYDSVMEGLLRGIRDGSLHLTRHSSPSTFLFLTLALAKIKWFRHDCVEVLLPQLHEGLGTFPGQFLGVVLLLGRREVKVCAVETTELILQKLLNAVQRRGCRYNAATAPSEKRYHKLDNTFLATIGTSPTEVITNHVHTADDASRDTEHDDDDDLQLLSGPGGSLPVGVTGGPTSTSDDVTIISGTPEQSVAAPKPLGHFTTSFIDIGSLSTFLECLHHIISTTVQHCRQHGQAAKCSELEAHAAAFYEASLSDAQAGVKSLNFLVERPGLVERLLLTLLQIPQVGKHPFITELTFAYATHIGGKRVRHQENESGSVSPLWQRRAANVIDLLLERGFLEQGTFVIPREVVQLAPRVVHAAECEHGQNSRIVQRDNVQIGDKTKRRVQAKTVLSRFASFARQMKQQG